MPGLQDDFFFHRQNSIFPDTTLKIQVWSSGQLEYWRRKHTSHRQSPICSLEHSQSLAKKSCQILPTIQSKQQLWYGYPKNPSQWNSKIHWNQKECHMYLRNNGYLVSILPVTILESRNYENTSEVIRSILKLTDPQRVPLKVTDG